MIYYIYYGYITGCVIYKIYGYWEIANIAYTTCNYTYYVCNGIYDTVARKENKIETDDWEIV